MVVVAPCWTDIVTDLHYKLAVVVAPCKTYIVIDHNYEMVLLVAIPCKIDIGHGARSQLQDGGSTKRKR